MKLIYCLALTLGFCSEVRAVRGPYTTVFPPHHTEEPYEPTEEPNGSTVSPPHYTEEPYEPTQEPNGPAVDCEWHEWSTWTDCTASCGWGSRTRSRDKKEAAHGGVECEGESNDSEDCIFLLF